MGDDRQNPRRGKRLLVASIGVATVSFLGLQTGCEDPDGQMTNVANLLVPLDASYDPTLIPDAARDAATDALVGTGNLLPPPNGNPDAALRDAASDAIVPSGNLVAPPDAALDAAADGATDGAADGAADGASTKDAAHPKDTGLPTSGNLLPLPPSGSR